MWKSITTYLKICCYNGVLMESPSHSRKLKNIIKLEKLKKFNEKISKIA